MGKLLDDSGPSENRILIFGRPRSLEILHFSKVWYCDGTFKVAPTIFAQVYIILAEALNSLIFALLPNKQEKTYDKLFDMLNLLKTGSNLRSVSCDFELSVINTIKKKYPDVL